MHNSENIASVKALTRRSRFHYFTSFFANSQYFHLIFIYFHSKLTSCDTCMIAGCYDSAYTVFFIRIYAARSYACQEEQTYDHI